MVLFMAVKLTGAGAALNDMSVPFATNVGPFPPPVAEVLGAR